MGGTEPPAKSPSGVAVFQEGRVSGLTSGEQETPSTEQIRVAEPAWVRGVWKHYPQEPGELGWRETDSDEFEIVH